MEEQIDDYEDEDSYTASSWDASEDEMREVSVISVSPHNFVTGNSNVDKNGGSHVILGIEAPGNFVYAPIFPKLKM